jgi:hypothetical protein
MSITNWGLSSLALLLSLNLFFNACTKEETIVKPTISVQVPLLNDVKYEEGRLKFASQEKFEEALEQMKSFQNQLSKFEVQFPGFISSKTAYKTYIRENEDSINPNQLPEFITSVVKDDGETYLQPSVDYKLIAHLANVKGIYQVGDVAYKVTYDNVFKT